jgi:diaminopimelate epimerase
VCGVPHLVQKIHQLKDAVDLKEMACEVRSHPSLGSAGANVTFYVVENDDSIQAVTFERGVEDFTLACGTGAVAAAFVHHAQTKASNIEVTMPGGAMRIYFTENQKRPLMEGEAVFIGDFQYSLEVFL